MIRFFIKYCLDPASGPRCRGSATRGRASGPGWRPASSGGGSRAIAFHLGCLRALHDRGALERVQVQSGISGGAALGTRAWARVRGQAVSSSAARRRSNRTDALEATLAKSLFGKATLEAPRRDEIDVILNACDLRTGSAVRFGSRESGIWRPHLGRIVEPVSTATAVAASAAYPLLLPSIAIASSSSKGETASFDESESS
jgi:NTE family protein